MLYDRDKFLVIFPRGNKSPIEESRSIYAGRRDEGTSFPWRWNSREFSTPTKLYQYVFLSSSVKVSRNERFTNVYRSTSRDGKGILLEESRSISLNYREDLFVSSKKIWKFYLYCRPWLNVFYEIRVNFVLCI